MWALLDRQGEENLLIPYFKSILWVSGITAGLSILALPLWLLGIPGVENQYAKGWKMGLSTIFLYPPAWLLNFGHHLLTQRQTNVQSREQWQEVHAWIALGLFLCMIISLILSFRTMSLPDKN